MITAATLNAHKSKELAQMAREKGIAGWHSMRKAELVGALLDLTKKDRKPVGRRAAKPVGKARQPIVRGRASLGKAGTNRVETAVSRKIRAQRKQEEQMKDLALIIESSKRHEAPEKDRLVLVVRDAWWLQAYWEITRASVQRARAAFSGNWHNAQPVLRLVKVSSSGNSGIEEVIQEIPIHGGMSNWFINVQEQNENYRVFVGYACKETAKFHLICKSNEILMPKVEEATDCAWNDITNDAQRYYSLSGGKNPTLSSADLRNVFEEKARQPMHIPAFKRLGSAIHPSGRKFRFDVDAHLIVHGTTESLASVSVGGMPVHVECDGTFALKVDLPDKRQVLPVIASSRDGTEQRTTVIAIERNTKVMEPLTRDVDEFE